MEIKSAKKGENNLTISEMVTEDYRRAEVFKKFGFDFCCGGKKTLNEACSEKGVNITDVAEALKVLDNQERHVSHDYDKWELDTLVDHIVETHHKYVNEALPLLDEFSTKVAKVHGNVHTEVVAISQYYQAIANELRMHMHKEEFILFPYIRQMAATKRNNEQLPPPAFGTIKNPIQMMETEHDSAGSTMEMIKNLSNNYTPPENACNTYRVLYAKLKEFEEYLHKHIHLENNILFPKAIRMEDEFLA